MIIRAVKGAGPPRPRGPRHIKGLKWAGPISKGLRGPMGWAAKLLSFLKKIKIQRIRFKVILKTAK
jgi:hypothetical protein